METTYNVVPSPAKDVPPEILKAYEDEYINLEALFTGGIHQTDEGKGDVEEAQDLSEDVPS